MLRTAEIISDGGTLRSNGGRILTGDNQTFFENPILKGSDMNKGGFEQDGAKPPPFL
jgi:hypothetical protein